jgi:hypothetical protein
MITLEQIYRFLEKKYTESDIRQRVDEEILEWVDEDWEEDECESEYDWYLEYRNGEAEDEVRSEIVKELERRFPDYIPRNEKEEFDTILRELWSQILDK